MHGGFHRTVRGVANNMPISTASLTTTDPSVSSDFNLTPTDRITSSSSGASSSITENELMQVSMSLILISI